MNNCQNKNSAGDKTSTLHSLHLILKLLQIKIIRLSVMADGDADKLHPVMCSGGRIFSL
ncbi:hypothetical protein L6N32_001603 [Salmonella enterica subsp. enterica serovar Poona]|nr:hypothetical protein [Salmonella enterica subsp. enterica serovar Poona]EEX0087858.1 hypothetical protein [Salmonella enterica]QVB77128.1 hypothetical protein JYM78_04145 [Salmonella enterica subsp. enterica serovar Rubislaw]EIU8082503.1 hypothetical protein [Salmonella enterica subsp. enterica serovar Poona]EIW3209062.1 hypothetical protein [Salmonella enterica subsp. enterica serovar Poona]